MVDAAGTRDRVEPVALLWALVAVVLILSALPLVRLLLEGIAPGGEPSTQAIRSVFANPVTWIATQHSIVTALGGTILATIIGSVVAIAVSLTDIRARNAFVFCF